MQTQKDSLRNLVYIALFLGQPQGAAEGCRHKGQICSMKKDEVPSRF